MFLIAIFAWIAGVVVSFAHGNRKLPLVVLILGLGLFFGLGGNFGLAGIAILAVVIWIANKAAMF